MILGVFLNASFLPAGLVRIDHALFYELNGQWHNGFLDTVVPFLREPTVWVPFYFFLLLFSTINYKLKGWAWVLFFILTAIITDQVSSHWLKDTFFRLRPCRDPDLAYQVRFLVSYCPMSSSFPSSHAVNHFGISTFIFVTFKKVMGKKWGFIFLWAAAICYAQVYVGVHFPFDVFSGAIIGIVLGFLTASFFNKAIGLGPIVK